MQSKKIATIRTTIIMPLRTDPFQRLTLCGAFQLAMEVFIAQPTIFLCIGVLGVLPNFIMNLLLYAHFADLFSVDEESDPKEVSKPFDDIFLGLIHPFFTCVLADVCGIFLQASTVRATIHVIIQKKPMLSQDLKHGLTLLPHIFCLHCALFVVWFVATKIFWITFIFNVSFQFALVYYTYIIFIFWAAPLVVQDLSGYQAFFRRYDLIQGQCCFVVHAISLEFMALCALIGLHHFLFSSFGPNAVTIAQSMTGVVLSPYADIFFTLLYVNARIKRGEECNRSDQVQEIMVDSKRRSYTAAQFGIQSDFAPCNEKVDIMDTAKHSVHMV